MFSCAIAQPVPEVVQDMKTGSITGQIMLKGGMPLSWAQIMFYDAAEGSPPRPDKYERIPDISKNIDAEGKFQVDLPEGRYYMGAIKRLSGELLGPPQAGDYVFRSLNEDGKAKVYEIKAGENIDAGSFSEAFQLTAGDLLKRRVTTAIKGVVRDADGNAVNGAVVLAFEDPSIGKRPRFASDKTDEEGEYILPLTEGTYYLRVRNSFAAGPAQPGQIVGYYGEGKPAPAIVRDCEIKEGIDLQVIVFSGRGPFSGTAPAKK